MRHFSFPYPYQSPMRPPITTMLVEVTMPAMTKLFDLEGSAAKDGRKCDKMSFTYGYVAPFCNNNLHRSLCLVVGWIKHLIQSGFYDKTCKYDCWNICIQRFVLHVSSVTTYCSQLQQMSLGSSQIQWEFCVHNFLSVVCWWMYISGQLARWASGWSQCRNY